MFKLALAELPGAHRPKFVPASVRDSGVIKTTIVAKTDQFQLVDGGRRRRGRVGLRRPPRRQRRHDRSRAGGETQTTTFTTTITTLGAVLLAQPYAKEI